MRHRTIVLLRLFALVTVVTTGALAASPASSELDRDRVASRSLAQASPAATFDPGIVGNLTITIKDGDTSGEFESITSEEDNDGYIIWNNLSGTTHDLEITIQGVVTNKIQLESNESYHVRLHKAGVVHWKCTTHGEGGILQ